MPNTLLPIIAASANTRLRNLLAIAAGGRDEEIEIVGHVWSNPARAQIKAGRLRAIRDSEGKLVCFKQVGPKKEQLHRDPAESWQKTPSDGVHTMQLKIGRRGRVVPTCQRSEAVSAHAY